MGGSWVPVKLVNPIEKPLTLKGNAKVADVSSCLRTYLNLITSSPVHSTHKAHHLHPGPKMRYHVLSDMCLQDLDLSSCEVSIEWKDKLLQIVHLFETQNGLW